MFLPCFGEPFSVASSSVDESSLLRAELVLLEVFFIGESTSLKSGRLVSFSGELLCVLLKNEFIIKSIKPKHNRQILLLYLLSVFSAFGVTFDWPLFALGVSTWLELLPSDDERRTKKELHGKKIYRFIKRNKDKCMTKVINHGGPCGLAQMVHLRDGLLRHVQQSQMTTIWNKR